MKNTKFKQTEIGEIPVDWEVKELGDIGGPKMCKRIMKNETSEQGDIPFFKIGTFGGTPDAFISNDTYARYKALYSYPKKGDILLSAAGTIGRTVIYNGEPAYYQDSNIVWIDNDETKALNKYLYYIYSRIEWDTSTGTIPRLYNNNLKSAKIPLPPTLAEQQRIAKALGDVDNAIATLEKLIQKKKNLKQGAMQLLLTGKKRLPGFAKSTGYKHTELGEIPEDWEVKCLGDLCAINDKINRDIPNNFFYIDLESVIEGKILSLNRIKKESAPSRAQRLFYKNDILYQTVRPYQKNNLYIDFKSDEFVASTGYAILRTNDKNCSLYLYQLIHTDIFVSQVLDRCTGTSYPAINPNKLKEIKILVPNSKSEQSAIAKVLSDMDKEIDGLNKKLQKYRQLKTAMMQQLLTGKIRLM